MPVNTDQRFESQLLLENGEAIAHGFARIHLAQKAVSFESDFVPLYPMGTPMEIVRLFGGKPIHRFLGKVYLSDKRLMKLVSVTDELLPGADQVYCRDMPFSAIFTLLPPQKNEGGVFSLFRPKSTFEELIFTAPITEISEKELTFHYTVDVPLEVGQQLLLNANMPLPIPKTVIQIVKPLWFGQTASYQCNFINLSPTEQENISYFLKQYHQKKHKLF